LKHFIKPLEFQIFKRPTATNAAKEKRISFTRVPRARCVFGVWDPSFTSVHLHIFFVKKDIANIHPPLHSPSTKQRTSADAGTMNHHDLVQPLLEQQEANNNTPAARGPVVEERECNHGDPEENHSTGNNSTGHSNGAVNSNNNEATISDDIQNPWKNRNVLLSLLNCILAGIADSIWVTIVLSGFLLALGDRMGQASHDNTLVGAAEAVQGMTQLITALPVGVVADVYGKAKIVRLGGVLMLFTIALTLWALIIVRRDADDVKTATFSYYVMMVALGLWGLVSGISYGPSQALYADSIPQGKRSEMLTWLYTCYLLSSSTGPIVSIILLLTVSSNTENWSIEEIFPVFFVGVVLEIPSAVIMFFFSDDYVIHEEVTSALPAPETTTTTSSSSGSEEELIVNGEGSTTTTEQASQQQQQHASSSSCRPSCNRKFWLFTNKACVPYVVFVSGLVVSLGSGASVKYFPLFFKELGLKQAAVQAIYLFMPVFISGLSFVAQRASRSMGRIETTILFYIIGTALLYYLTYLSQSIPSSSSHDGDDGSSSTMTTRSMIWHDDEHGDATGNMGDDHASVPTTLWQENPRTVIWIVIIWWLRTGIMNAVYPLLESILMDVVPSNQRARWKSLESIAAVGWTGSALVGGILSDSHSYQFTFVITATMQLVGAFLLIPIQPLVEMERSIAEEQQEAQEQAATTQHSDDTDNNPETVRMPPPEAFHQPLLVHNDRGTTDPFP
jgi:MFS family permease